MNKCFENLYSQLFTQSPFSGRVETIRCLASINYQLSTWELINTKYGIDIGISVNKNLGKFSQRINFKQKVRWDDSRRVFA